MITLKSYELQFKNNKIGNYRTIDLIIIYIFCKAYVDKIFRPKFHIKNSKLKRYIHIGYYSVKRFKK